MNDLLALALDAHGGLERWAQITQVEADLAITGAVWHAVGKPDFFAHVTFRANTHDEVVTLDPVGGPGRRSVFEDGRMALQIDDGAVLQLIDDPEASYRALAPGEPWNDLQAAYFTTEAIWTYLTTPFLYTYPGFVTEEIEPWVGDGETWRSLQVTFPAGIASHTRTQISRFGPDGLLRRHDYTVDILGGATGANYAGGYVERDGIQVPTTRRVYAYDNDRRKVPEPLLVAVDVDRIHFS